MPVARILLIDDDRGVRESIAPALTSELVQVESVGLARSGIERVATTPPDVVLLDLELPDLPGLDALAAMRELQPRLPVIIITAHGSTHAAIEATRRGAFDYLVKPFDCRQLRAVVDRALHASRLSFRPAPVDVAEGEDGVGDELLGQSVVMQEVFKAIGRVSDTDVNVLLLGESGAGKDLVARAIHQHSRRAAQPWLAINCAAIPETLLESELFGHERGAFTGADRVRVGRFEQARGGTLFLDEIGDMHVTLQAKILRVLQDQRFERLGGRETIETDVRVIAATNQNLVELVAAGRFRQDLFYRLNTYTIAVPPLRLRRGDLPMLTEHFIRRYRRELGKIGGGVTGETLKLLEQYTWPGNVRELQSVIKTALINAEADVITPECLPAQIVQPPGGQLASDASGVPHFDLAELITQLLDLRQPHLYRHVGLAVDRLLLDAVLSRVGGNQVEAARLLGISRTTLRAKLEQFGRVTDRPESEPNGERPA